MSMLTIAFIFLVIFLLAGVPISFGIALSGVLALVIGSDVPIYVAVQQMVRGVNSFPMMAAPFFILAGEIMSGAKLSSRIIEFCRALVSWARGGLGMVSVVANMIFAGITGTGSASMTAIGNLVTPDLRKAGYDRGFTAALIAGGGALGPIIPPSVNMIIFASLTGVSTGKLFVGGIVPGFFIGGFLIAWCWWFAKKHDIDPPAATFSLKRVWKSFINGLFALIMPIIIIGGVLLGVFTATEAGIIACVYGLICGFFIYRTLKLRDLPKVFKSAARSTAMVMMIVGVANIFSYIFAREQLGQLVKAWMLGISSNPTVVVLLILAVMLVIGCFMETVAAMIVILPIIYPAVAAMGVDPIMFGVMFSIATIIGALTPPVGLYLFMSMGITGAPFTEVVKYIFFPIIVIFISLTIMIFWPPFVSWLPNLLMG